MKILLVEGRFYENLSEELASGAIAEINKSGFEFDRLFVPGALEIPAAINFATASNLYDGYIALGCVIRGETFHFDVVCNESAHALMDLSINKNLCIGNGILTVENEEQAWERAAINKMNKGGGAAVACIEMIKIKNRFVNG